MKFNVLNRKVHYWASIGIALPVLVILLSGILLQMKKHWSWVQPAELRGSATAPQVAFEDVLRAVQGVPEMDVAGWEDIRRVDVRPGRGVAKVWLTNGWEVQVDLGTGEVLQTAYRRSDWIESIHDGSFFAGDVTRLGLFLPAGFVLLLLWGSGLWMFWVPFSAKLKRKKRSA